MGEIVHESFSVERQLAHSEESLRLLVESVSDYAIFMLDPHGFVVSWNLGAERINGYTGSEILGKHLSVFYTPKDIDSSKAEQELLAASTQGRYEERGWRVRKDGSRYLANVVLTPVLDDGILRGYAKVVRDITDEDALQGAEERFKLLVESVQDYAIFMLDTKGYVRSWNPGAQRIKGYTAEEILGHHFSRFYPFQDIESGKPERELEIAIREGKYEEEGWRLRKDSSQFWASVVITPVRDGKGVLQGFAKVTRDMTSRRESEELLRDLNRQLEVFAYSVSHDLRGPLRSIVFTSRILLDDAGDQLKPETRELLQTQFTSATKLAHIVSDLLTLSRLSRSEMVRKPIDLTALGEEVAKDIFQENETTRCTFEIEKDLRAVGDRTLVSSILQNLFDNACKFSPNGGRIFFGKEPFEGAEAFVVRDQGIGFSMEYVGKLFLPFERLVKEEEFEGTGIGLSNVYAAVVRHGGRVWACSAPGAGSSFYFTLGQ